MIVHVQEFGTEKLRRAWATTEANQHDMEAWSLIIRDAQNRSIDSARCIFERLVTTFPTTGKFWKMYIEQEVCVSHLFLAFIFVETLIKAIYFLQQILHIVVIFVSSSIQ